MMNNESQRRAMGKIERDLCEEDQRAWDCTLDHRG